MLPQKKTARLADESEQHNQFVGLGEGVSSTIRHARTRISAGLRGGGLQNSFDEVGCSD